MKTLFHTLMLLAAALPALGASLPVAMMDTNGGFASPSKATFIRQNVLNQSGITRQVDFVTDLNAATSPYRSGEHVLVIDAGAFGAGGPVLFFHDSGSSDPTNTTDTFICTAGGRWKVKRVFGSIPAFADVTSKPTTLSGYGITDALPLSAGSNAPLTGTLHVPAIKLGSDIERTSWPAGGGGGGSLTVDGDTGNPVSNLVNSATTSWARTNGDVALEITATPASTLTGTIDITRFPSEAATDSEVAAAMGSLTNGTGTINVSNLNVTGTLNTGGLTVPTNAYSSTWATNNQVPTKRDLYAKIETLGVGGGSSNTFGSLTLSGRRAWPLIDDFMGGTTLAGDAGVVAVNNSGSHFIHTPEPGHQGLRRVRLSTNGAPAIGWGLNGASVILTNSGSDKWAWGSEIKVPTTLSGASGIEYGVFSGFINYVTTTNNPTDGIFFAYQTNYTASSVNWVFVTMTSSTAEATDTGVPVSANGWDNLQWVMNHTNVVASIDGVPVATNTTQIPWGVALAPHIKFSITSTNVATRDLIVDALLIDHAD